MTATKVTQLIAMCLANFPLAKNIDAKNTAALWLMTFKHIADDEFETAVRLCLMNCKSFPTLADIKHSIDELRADARTEPQLQRLPSRSRWTSPAAQKAFDIVRQGKAHEYIQQMDITDIADYARTKFPAISDDLIRRNYAELATAKQCADMCFACRINPGQCLTKGWFMVPVLHSEGWIENEMKKCQKAVS